MRRHEKSLGFSPHKGASGRPCLGTRVGARPARAVVVQAALAALGAAALASAPRPAAADPLSFGGGLLAGVGGNFLDKPGNRQYGAELDTLYPGFAGTSAAFGGFVEARLLGLVGLEIDLLSSSDYGKGDVTLNNAEYTIEIGQRAWHLPVLAKGVIPLPLLAPFIVVGPEFVFSSSPDASVDPKGYPAVVSARNDGYTLLTAGLGLEIKPPIPKLDIRIPFSLRASFNPGSPDTIGGRARYEGGGVLTATSANYLSEWKYRAYAMVGVGLHF
ncbi:MAG: hypothetical protein MUF34_09105 [Polyangiaceae bacterium]|jgi:hypothetical protein|nr:hypothetical protein [Polyangiaceae bacterium]